MAEPPHPWTDLLARGDWDGFAAALAAAGCAAASPQSVAASARATHAKLAARRHPPGPTVELLTVHRLVAEGLLTRAALRDFGG